ncbi:hypothetical protein CDAR_417401 [Caerostris darwini]|uniref:Uncharacterized protein n=1 Tax=Caerostris darwini TaxID=1538125 RepID=A0AAV4X700_9ARAC|nr:hypothetical protein CDAR_417401 [Caerostris darwini]
MKAVSDLPTAKKKNKAQIAPFYLVWRNKVTQSFEKAWERRDTLRRRKQSATLLTTLFRRFLDFLGGTRTFLDCPLWGGSNCWCLHSQFRWDNLCDFFPHRTNQLCHVCVDISIRIVWVAFRFDVVLQRNGSTRSILVRAGEFIHLFFRHL